MSKKALQRAPSKSAKITGFQIYLFLIILLGENFRRPPIEKIHFNGTGMGENVLFEFCDPVL
ncbi:MULTISPECIES: hypothetical protein [Methanosarcina]|uniref:hypothetical protein n=1 Tax=Methanosarcina TaxID=2207 RepID=UPI00064F0766|nr:MULTISPECIES: hypothetical protein [Methanosarcina]OED02099.1 hypothetical protein A9239_01745 [Methanosarcina sp. A14]